MDVGVKANFVVLQPTVPSNVPNGSIFIDSTNGNVMSSKDTSGAVAVVGGGGGGSNPLLKQMQAAGAIGLNKLVSKRPDGKIEQADSDSTLGQMPIGYAMNSASVNGDMLSVLCFGANVAGALTGLGFTPGDEVYLSETSGYTNDPNSFTGNNDSIIKVGIADCGAGIASATATDLITFAEVISRP